MSVNNGNLEILIVDDDEMTIFLHEVHVKECGFDSSPKSFYNGKDVVDYLNTYFNVAKHYCILLDINMPIMDSWDVMDEIKKQGMDTNVSVVILTSSINTADKIKAEQYDMVINYIEKPLNESHLEQLKSHDKLKSHF